MEAPTLIYCADGNAKLAQIAIDAGLMYGARLPGTVYHPVYFADQDWKNPSREAYMAALAEHKPHMATVVDWERHEQLGEVLAWAEDAVRYVDVVVVIPKVFDGIHRLPRTIGGKEVRLGYSVPTKFGGTPTGLWEFAGWPVHLLGGSPHRQMELAYYLDVRSVDGNMHNKMASQRCQFWIPEPKQGLRNRYWPMLKEVGIHPEGDAYQVAFEMSCKNIIEAWNRQCSCIAGSEETYA